MYRKFHLASATVFLAATMAGSALHAQTLAPFGPSGNYQFDLPVALNDEGDVVGFAASSQTLMGYEYTPGGGYTFLPTNSLGVFPNAINNSGQIAGTYGTPTYTGFQDVFIYSNAKGYTDISGAGLLGTGDAPPAINNAGVVVGSGVNNLTAVTAFVYQNGVVTDLPASNPSAFNPYSVPGYTADFAATGINDAGLIALWDSQVPSEVALTYNLNTKVLTSLGNLGGFQTHTTGINAQGDVVGGSYLPGNNQEDAFLYSNGTMQDIGNLGGNYALAVAINNAGVVVGTANLANGDDTAFVYSAALGKMNALDTKYAGLLVAGGVGSPDGFVSLDQVSGINNEGEIIGEGTYWNGTTAVQEGFVLNDDVLSVPEPSTWAMLLGGCGLLVLLQRRVRKV